MIRIGKIRGSFIVVLAFLLMGNALQGRRAHSLSLTVKVVSEKGQSLVRLKIRCVVADTFTEGKITLAVSPDSGGARDSIELWSGDSDSQLFDRSFDYTFHLPVGGKADIHALAQCKLKNFSSFYKGIPMSDEVLYLHRLEDTLIVSGGDYRWLERVEVGYERNKRGYRNISVDSIETIDPQFWLRLMRVSNPKFKR